MQKKYSSGFFLEIVLPCNSEARKEMITKLKRWQKKSGLAETTGVKIEIRRRGREETLLITCEDRCAPPWWENTKKEIKKIFR